MFSPSFFEQLEDRLNLAVYDINHMGIADLQHQFAGLPGIGSLTMDYGHGGKTEIYVMGDIKVELPAGASHETIGAALAKAAAPSALARVDSAVAALDTKKKLLELAA